MSRIIRSRDAPKRKGDAPAFELDRAMVAHPNRPKGGVAWIRNGSTTANDSRPGQYERRRLEGEEIIRSSKREAERIQQEAYHKGFAHGEAAGKKLASQKIEVALESLKTLATSVGEARRELVERHEAELIRLALLISTRILHREIEMDHEAVINVARAALAKVVKAERIMIKVSPYDLVLLQRQFSEASGAGSWLPENARIEGDDEIGRGGCRIFTDSGEVDATIETQLHLLKTVLWNE